MTTERPMSHLPANAWFLAGMLLVLAGYTTPDPELLLWSALWFIPEIVVLALIWRGSDGAWRVFVAANVVVFGALGVVLVGVVVGTGFVIDIQWWGPVCHGLAFLAIARFRVVRTQRHSPVVVAA